MYIEVLLYFSKNLLLNIHLFPNSELFNFLVLSILCCCFYETLEILVFPAERQLCIVGPEALGLTQFKIPFPWKLKCFIGALCFQGIQIRTANTMLGNRKSPSSSLQKVSISLLSWFCLNILGTKICKLYIAISYTGI